jgi:hypothetical protein
MKLEFNRQITDIYSSIHSAKLVVKKVSSNSLQKFDLGFHGFTMMSTLLQGNANLVITRVYDSCICIQYSKNLIEINYSNLNIYFIR